MALYSPRRGFVEVYEAYFGPKVRTVAVGTDARLVSSLSFAASSAAWYHGHRGNVRPASLLAAGAASSHQRLAT
jgi:hypothetical protein